MNHTVITRYFVFCVLMFVSFGVFAQTKFIIAPGIMNFDYVETDADGTFLDGEKGSISGLKLGVNVKTKSKIDFGFTFEYYSGLVDYDGHLQSLTDPPDLNVEMAPFKSETEETVNSLAGYIITPISPSTPGLSIYGSLTTKIWERLIKGRFVTEDGNLGQPINQFVPDTYEKYEWWQFDIGLLYKVSVTPKSYMNFKGGFLRTLNPTMRVSTSNLNLGEKWGYELGAEWLYKITQKHSLGVGGEYNYWEFGRSNLVFDSGLEDFILEPDSESKMFVFRLIYEYVLN
jgi:hypothetical protein